MHQPWVVGPAEILEHGLQLLKEDKAVNRRLALICIDNAVELMIKTYLGLPKRLNHLHLSRREYEEIAQSFPKLLDTLEKNKGDELVGINLGEIEWFHRLRNYLYHQGYGLTVAEEHVLVYAEIAKLLFKRLFGIELPVHSSSEVKIQLYGTFITQWADFERNLIRYLQTYRMGTQDKKLDLTASTTIKRLKNLFNDHTIQEMVALQALRQQAVQKNRLALLFDINAAKRVKEWDLQIRNRLREE